MIIPIQVASITDTNGKITPSWFKLKDNEGGIHKSIINSIQKRTETNVSVSLICWAIQDEQDILKMVEIHYNIREHKWVQIIR